jgi:hypothetical protein
MAEKILKDAAQLGSSLTAFANRQLSTMLGELGGLRDGQDDGRGRGEGLPLGQLASNVFQIVNLTGSLLVQLSKYDLVRQDSSVMLLDSGNSLSSITVRAQQSIDFPMLVENNGRQPRAVMLFAKIDNADWQPMHELELQVSERRRVPVQLPAQMPGKRTLMIKAEVLDPHGDRVTIARKTVAVTVLPEAAQHEA